MKLLPALALLTLIVGCGRPPDPVVNKKGQEVTCDGDAVPVYTNTFSPRAGSSGVATGADAAAGKVNSDGASTTTPPPEDSSLSAMSVTCGNANCAPGLVAVQLPPPASANGSGGIGGPATAGAGDAPTPTPAPPAPPPTGTTVCTSPPPVCPEGLSPQYTLSGNWECTDCTLVVTYGGIYANYRRCVGMPTITCNDGEVPTFVYEDEKWECKTKCDNGQYDQHTIGGVLVCVPC